MSGFRSPEVRYGLIALAVILGLLLSVAYYAEIAPSRSTSYTSTTSSKSLSSQTSIHSTSTAFGSSQTSVNSTIDQSSYSSINQTSTILNTTSIPVGATFYYPISINYSGSWNLRYWVEYGAQPNSQGNLNGSGNYETTVKFDVVGNVQETLCANATKLDLRNNSTLTLSVLSQRNSTTASNRWAYVCAAEGV